MPTLLSVAAVTALACTPALAHAKPPAGNPGDRGFQLGSPVTPKAHQALVYDGGTIPEDPETTPFKVIGADLKVGPSISSAALAANLLRTKPLTTDALVASITGNGVPTDVASLRTKIANIARQFLTAPTLEDKGNRNRGRIICALNGPEACGWAWCAMFASSVWRLAGIRSLPVTPPVSGVVAWAVAHGRWKPRTFTARTGDLVAFGCNRKRDFCQHIGIVMLSSPDSIETIEGNTTSAYKGREGVGARLRDRDSWISGYVSLG